MTRPSDETLSAYIDGALDPAAATEVAAYLETDAETRNTVEKLRRIDALAAQAFSSVMTEPPSQTLIDLIRSAPGGRAAQHADNADNVIQLRPKQAQKRFVSSYVLPAAAILTLALGLGVAYIALERSRINDDLLAAGPVARGTALAGFLESGRSGQSTEIGKIDGTAGGRATLVSVFRDRTSRYCREIEFSGAAIAAPPQSVSVACRSQSGTWAIEGSVSMASSSNISGTAPGYEPSGAANVEPLNDLLSSLGASRSLDSYAEETAIKNGWN